MEVEAFNQKILNVLSKGTFIIPDYQREYDWDESEISELLDDLENISTRESYFIGHMVFEGKFTGNTFKVIDGQQRITTLTIMLSVIRDIFYEKGLDNLGDAINDKFIFSKDMNNNTFVILENKMPYPILQSYVQSKPNEKNLKVKPQKSGEKKIIETYDYFKKNFSAKLDNELIDLRDKILNLEVIFVAASDKVDAHTIFMTLNGTGKNLSAKDLIKNQIFSLYPKQTHLDEPNDTWQRIVSNLNDNPRFLNNYWASRYKKIAEHKLFKEFYNEFVKPKKDMKFFLNDLEKFSINYKKVTDPSLSDWNRSEYEIYFSLNAIVKIFNIDVANTFLINLIEDYNAKRVSKAYLLKAFKIIEEFHFKHNAICSLRSSGLDTFYAKYARNTLAASNKHDKHIQIDLLVNELKNKMPSKNIFELKFDSKLFYSSKDSKQKRLIQYVLNKIEAKFHNNNILLNNVSIEHIYPEKPKDTVWVKLSNSQIAYNIGNLVLLDAAINSDIGNKNFIDKKKIILSKSSIITTKKVFEENEDWNENNILERRNFLLNYTFENMWE